MKSTHMMMNLCISYVFKDKIGASLEMCERKININYYCWCYFYFACLYSVYNILLNTRKLAPFLIIMLNSWFFVVKRSIYFARSSKHVIITLTILTQPLFGYSDDILLWKPSYMFFFILFSKHLFYTHKEIKDDFNIYKRVDVFVKFICLGSCHIKRSKWCVRKS